MEHDQLQQLISANGLPSEFSDTVSRWYQPLAKAIADCHSGSAMVLGVQGSQGSGKSTLAQFLNYLFERDHGLSCIALSLDDFYLKFSERANLAKTEHPLLQTRGVPGTHDVELAINTITQLRTQTGGQQTAIPRFNKAVDDRFPESEWDLAVGKIDLIIFEGWCVGVEAEREDALTQPINTLESTEDVDGTWRHYVNHALKNSYRDLFALIDKLVVLEAPSFDCVYEWRWLQEQKLAAKWRSENPTNGARLLDEASVRRFISHYERLTRQCFRCLPEKADWRLPLDANHQITDLIYRQ